MAKYKDFCGFRFGNIHSSDLHLVVVSSSKRYEKRILPDSSDYTTSVPGGDGDYYFGSTFKQREISINVAFDEISENDFRRISQIFSTDQLKDLVFDELPFKTYKAKLKSKPEFKFVCFTDRHTNERVYKGEGTLKFVCYFPYAVCDNKYVVRAADYYRCTMPEEIITNSIEDNPYKRKEKPKMLPGIIKNHYNVRDNMNTNWKGGYPTIEQVQAGELYFNDPIDNSKKLIIDVRGYWKNVPEWESSAKLLTTPTLDYERELIYLPQYNRVNYMNMDTGLINEQGLIGSRILVYNPGDIPVDFELKIGNLKKRFHTEENDYRFRISRYNVERLPIPCAVDWTGMKTTFPNQDEKNFKYGTRYFRIMDTEIIDNQKKPVAKLLKTAHPSHAYYVEPIPRQKLSHYIKLFYWQSFKLNLISKTDYLKGVDIANYYQELYNGCIEEMEQYDLYWHTLKDAILYPYYQFYLSDDSAAQAKFEQLCYYYFQCPPEYFSENDSFKRKYGQFDFNLSKLPIYITEDYFEITTKDLWETIDDSEYLEPSNWGIETDVSGGAFKYREQRLPNNLFLDTERRMLYNINDPDWSQQTFTESLAYGKDKLWDEYDNFDNFYNYKPTKTIHNESIVQGKWFKLPPGWSLIDISPVLNETKWGGKLWRDARPFDWGNPDEQNRQEFYNVYEVAVRDYLKGHCPENILTTFGKYEEVNGSNQLVNNLDDYTLEELENLLQFRRWFGNEMINDLYKNDFITKSNNQDKNNWKNTKSEIFYNTLVHKLNEKAEYEFLKLLSSYWNITHLDDNGKISSTIDNWWWYACNYLWANFPPLYWGYVDLLNSIEIKYTPLFY